MDSKECEVCMSKKTGLTCHLCSKASCKHCIQFVDEDIFLLQSLLPDDVRDKGFCPSCFDENISGQLSDFLETMERAKNVNVYEKVQGTETRLMRRVQKPIKILECDDREETLMRLAYIAAQMGYDTIVDVDLVSKKVSTGGRHKKLVWSGIAVPIDSTKRR